MKQLLYVQVYMCYLYKVSIFNTAKILVYCSINFKETLSKEIFKNMRLVTLYHESHVSIIG